MPPITTDYDVATGARNPQHSATPFMCLFKGASKYSEFTVAPPESRVVVVVDR